MSQTAAERRIHMKRLLAKHRETRRPCMQRYSSWRKVGKLREFTGWGPGCCKMALEQNKGDLIDAAVWLRDRLGDA